MQDGERNIEISRGNGGLEDLNFSLVPLRVEQVFSIDVMSGYVAAISIFCRQVKLYLSTKLRKGMCKLSSSKEIL